MVNKRVLVYIVSIVIASCILLFVLAIWEFGHNFVGSGDTRDPACHIHEENRISFYLKTRGLDLTRMLDSLETTNSQYKFADISAMENFNHCECCCIVDDKEIYFNESPKEIYWIHIERYRYNAGFEGQYNDDIGYIDIVSTYKNGDWRCSVTSKLDSLEKRRIRNRINNEIIPQLPMIRDTSSHKDEL